MYSKTRIKKRTVETYSKPFQTFKIGAIGGESRYPFSQRVLS